MSHMRFNNISLQLQVAIEDLKQVIQTQLMGRYEAIQGEVEAIVEDYFQTSWKEELEKIVRNEIQSQVRLYVQRNLDKKLYSIINTYAESVVDNLVSSLDLDQEK